MLKLFQNLPIDGCIAAKYIKIMDFFFLQFLKRAVQCRVVECTMIFSLKMLEKSYSFHTVMLNLYQKLLIGSYIAAKYTKITYSFFNFSKKLVSTIL